MADEDDRPSSPSIPSWQRPNASDADATPNSLPQGTSTTTQQDSNNHNNTEETSQSNDRQDTQQQGQDEDPLAVARRFLEDENVKTQPREKKVSFLRAKGLSDGDIDTLLQDDIQTVEKTTPSSSSSSSSPPSEASSSSTHTDRAPIVTYPEFLQSSKDDNKSPLVTTTRLLTALQITAALSSAIYGTSRFLLTPMLERLNESRGELHESVAQNLSALVTKLEGTVSEIPTTAVNNSKKKAHGEDASEDSEDDDPSEMFHRDIGTQTTTPPPASSSPSLSNKDSPASGAEAQTTQIKSLVSKLSALRDDIRSQSDDLGDVKTLIDVFRDDLDVLTYRNYTDSSGGGGTYDYFSKSAGGAGKAAENKDDEIRKARDNIRRIKGVLLSTRTFPVSTR